MSQELSSQELRDQINNFFDEAIERLESRRSELLADIENHIVTPEIQTVDTIESADEAKEKLEPACLSQCGKFDAHLASRRMERLLLSLRIDWQDEWLMRRQADNPFASLANAADADTDEDVGSSDLAGCGYNVVPEKVDFGAVLASGIGVPDEQAEPFSVDHKVVSMLAADGGASRRGRNNLRAPRGGRGGFRTRARPFGRGASLRGYFLGRLESTKSVEDVEPLVNDNSKQSSHQSAEDEPSDDSDEEDVDRQLFASRGGSRGDLKPRTNRGRPPARRPRGARYSRPSARGTFESRGGPATRGGHEAATSAPDDTEMNKNDVEALSAVRDSLPFECLLSFSLRNHPVSLTYLSGMYFTIELPQKRIFVYNSGGNFVKVFFFSYTHLSYSPPVIHPYRIRSCAKRKLLIVIDRSNRQVLVAEPAGRLQFRVGPDLSQNRKLAAPEDAASTGQLLIIISPRAGIYIVSLNDQLSASSVADCLKFLSLSDYKLFAPIRIVWEEHHSRLILVDHVEQHAYRLCALKITYDSSTGSVDCAHAECQGEAFQSLVIPSVELVQNCLLLGHRVAGVTEFLRLDPKNFCLLKRLPIQTGWLLWNFCQLDGLRVAACCNNGCVFTASLNSFM